jgi:hypothetical protein
MAENPTSFASIFNNAISGLRIPAATPKYVVASGNICGVNPASDYVISSYFKQVMFCMCQDCRPNVLSVGELQVCIGKSRFEKLSSRQGHSWA